MTEGQAAFLRARGAAALRGVEGARDRLAAARGVAREFRRAYGVAVPPATVLCYAEGEGGGGGGGGGGTAARQAAADATRNGDGKGGAFKSGGNGPSPAEGPKGSESEAGWRPSLPRAGPAGWWEW